MLKAKLAADQFSISFHCHHHRIRAKIYLRYSCHLIEIGDNKKAYEAIIQALDTMLIYMTLEIEKESKKEDTVQFDEIKFKTMESRAWRLTCIILIIISYLEEQDENLVRCLEATRIASYIVDRELH